MSFRPFPSTLAFIFALPLAFAPLNPKIGGLAWLIYAGFGCWVGLRYLVKPQNADIPRELSPVAHAARIWLIACLVATILRWVPHAFWQDDWGRRHAEARLLIGALAAAALVKWPPVFSFSMKQRIFIGHSLACACLVGLWVTSTLGRNTPTHPIAWAVALSFLVCILAPMTLDTAISNSHRRIWLVAAGLGLLGVLLSQSRGAYGLLVLLLFAGFTAFSNRSLGRPVLMSRSTFLFCFAIFASLFLLSWLDPNWLYKLLHRLLEAWGEVTMSSTNMSEAANTSVGSRLYLWGKSLDAIELQPWLGYGKENTAAMIRAWGVEINSAQIQQLGHLHNEFLDAWTSHGLLGLLSLVVLMMGLGLAAKTLWVPHPTAAKALAGILFMHITAGLSNVNMAHNYYGAMLSLSVGLALLLASSEDAPR